MEITIRADQANTNPNDPFAGLGSIVLRTDLLRLGNLDAAAESEVTINGQRYVITDVQVKPRSQSDAVVTLEVVPASADPFEETREERQPEW